MLKLLFICLLILNVLFLGYTHLADDVSGREPERVKNQLNPEKLVLLDSLPEPDSPTIIVSTTSNESSAPPLSLPVENGTNDSEVGTRNYVCLNTNALALERRTKIVSMLRKKDLVYNERVSTQIKNYWVFIPGKTQTAIQQILAQLKDKAVNEYYAMEPKSGRPRAVSLGIFSTEGAAASHQNTIRKLGVQAVQTGPFKTLETYSLKIGPINDKDLVEIKSNLNELEISEVVPCKKPSP